MEGRAEPQQLGSAVSRAVEHCRNGQ
jgi:hypothetical protein